MEKSSLRNNFRTLQQYAYTQKVFISFMSETEIVERLSCIEEESVLLRKHILDADLLVTDDDIEALDNAEEDLKEKKGPRGSSDAFLI